MENSKLIFLLIAGLPGTGKTTLSRALGRDLQWHVIDKDALKKAFLDQGLENEAAGYFQIFRHLPEDTFVLYTNRSLKECLADARMYLDS